MELYISGGFDVLHENHKKYIQRCIAFAIAKFKIDSVAIGLIDSGDLTTKGSVRPLFSYVWRKKDLLDWVSGESFKNIKFKVEKLETSGFKEFPQSKKMLKRIIAISNEHRSSRPIQELCNWHPGIIFVDPIGKFHTSDIPDGIWRAKKTSGCFVRKVAAALIRDGRIIKISKNGSEKKCLVGDCEKYKDLMLNYRRTGKRLPSKVPCDFPHAEKNVLRYAKKGDDLIVTNSPCMECAKEIVKRGIRRIVFFEQYHDKAALSYLKKHEIIFRMAGVG